ncbi:MAG: 30S ribosomal protein S15 [Candidatus Omnitrophota bacterium]|nr:MAG: 30S ribosomal protein S15 [Candidatus Omnitrophota bacterium]
MTTVKQEKEKIISEFKVHDKDTGSADVQIALLTARINRLTEHFKIHKKDFSSRRGLLQLVSMRRRLLDYLKRENFKKYKEILVKLKLRK